jgi:type VI secretion system protein ImpA
MANLDLEELLREISAQAPSGDNLEDDFAFTALQTKAKIIPEQVLGNITQAEQLPNWKDVRKDLLKLMEKTRDLRLLLELVRVELNVHGAAGLAESLELLRRSLETYWDSVHPQLDPEDDNDPSQRVNILRGLCDSGSVLRFLQAMPLVESRAFGRYSLRDIHIANGKIPTPQGVEAPSMSSVKGAFTEVAQSHPGVLTDTHDALKTSFAITGQIEALVTEKVGISQAPSFQALRDKLKEALYAMDEQMALCGLGVETPVEIETPEESPSPGTQPQRIAPPQAPGQLGGINSREDVVKALDLICDYYARFEPSSPVPILAQRAKRLATKSFMEIIEDLAPDGLNQIRLIKGNDPEGEG